MRSSFDFEKDFGINCFVSNSDGIGGKLRASPEDFVVEEQGEPRPGEGYTAIKIRYRNWESHGLRLRIQRDLGLREGDITVAGTKDKRAIATQWMTLKRRSPPKLNIPDVKILETRPSSSMLRSGEHDGNKFIIRVKETDIDGEEALNRAKTIIEEVDNDWPNFFGVQRFGAYRPITHLVGRALVKESAESAVRMYLGSPGNTEGEERRAREMVEEGAAWEDVLDAMPPGLKFEKMMLFHLVGREDDYEGALLKLPHTLLRLLVHSYQSYLFNLALSERLAQGLRLDEPVEGDLIQPPVARMQGGKPRFVPVSKASIPAVTKAIKQGKGSITGFLPGSDPIMAKGAQGEIEHKILEQEKLDRKVFQINGLPEASSHGTRRPILLVPQGIGVAWDDGLVASFTLSSGSYATTVLREIMKSPKSRRY